jgi:hypothetical protein
MDPRSILLPFERSAVGCVETKCNEAYGNFQDSFAFHRVLAEGGVGNNDEGIKGNLGVRQNL